MFNVIRGKGAMIWRLREIEDGDPERIAAAAVQSGLDWVSIKIVDGTDRRWESEWRFPDNQNDDLLPEVIAALREKGVTVIAWIWTYGTYPERVWGSPSIDKGIAEAEVVVDAAIEYGIEHVQIDAESTYKKPGMTEVARAFCQRLNRNGPEIEYSLCSYRFPLANQPAFPVRTFASHMDAWCPQVYFIEDNRVDGGARQVQESYMMYRDRISDLPFFPILPTYRWVNPNTGEPWTASGEQIRLALQRSVDIGLPAAGVWDWPQANAEQRAALADFEWPEEEPPIPRPGDFAQRLRSLAVELRETTGADLDEAVATVDSFGSEIESIADELDNS